MYRGGWAPAVNYWPKGWTNTKSNTNRWRDGADGQADKRTNGQTDQRTNGHRDPRTDGLLGKHSVRLADQVVSERVCVSAGCNVKFDKLWISLAATERRKQSFGILCIFLCQKFNTANYPSSIATNNRPTHSAQWVALAVPLALHSFIYPCLIGDWEFESWFICRWRCQIFN